MGLIINFSKYVYIARSGYWIVGYTLYKLASLIIIDWNLHINIR